jgi:formyl-CoA transferase
MPGALHGVKVLEIAQVMAIPICGMLLSDLGAEVTKLEPPWGDASRYTMQPVLPGESKSFAVLNRGKRSVGLNLADERTRPALEALVRRSDVVLVSAKAEDLVSFLIGYEDLRELNPDLIYLDHSGYGRNGPMGDQGGYDLTVGGLSGITALIGREHNDQPIYTQPAVLDLCTGILSAMAVCGALYARQSTGKGQRIETSLLATAMLAQVNVMHDFPAVEPDYRPPFLEALAALRRNGASYLEMQALRNRSVRRAVAGNIYYRYYRTKDSYISIGCLSPELQRRFRETLGVVDPRTEPGFDMATDEGYQRMRAFVGEAEGLMRARTTDAWIALLLERRIPCAPVLFPEETIDDPQVAANDYVIELQHEILGPYRTFAPAVRMDGTPTEAQGAAPPLGAHTAEVLREAGLSEELIGELIDAGVAGGAPLEG